MREKVNLAFKVLFRTYKGTNYATWLRGMAAIGVLTIHYGGLGLRELFPEGSLMSKFVNNLVDFGGQGPTIFFVASGYVLQKYSRNLIPIWKIFLTRYLRLSPAYIFVLFFSAILNKSVDQLSIVMLVKKVLFLDIFFIDAYEFNPIGIGYFVVVEFWLTTFLLLGPLMFKGKGLIAQVQVTGILTLSFLFSYFASDLASVFGIPSYHLDILKYQFFFILGMMCTRWHSQSNTQVPARISAILSFVIALNLDTYLGYVAAVFAIAILLSEDREGSRILFGKLPIFIGNICYSIYLTHIPVIIFAEEHFSEIQKPLVALLVIPLSTAIFLSIEQPFIKLGKRIAIARKRL